MYSKTPIICPKCGAVVAYEEDIMYLYMPNGLRCPYCGTEVLAPSGPMFYETPSTTDGWFKRIEFRYSTSTTSMGGER